MGTNPVRRDATARTVSENVKRLREQQNLGLRGLANRLGDVGRRLGHSAVDQIEKGTRRVDVDDLMALAEALNVSPITLLMPQTTIGGEPVKTGDELVQATCRPTERAEELWDRLRALHLRSGIEGTVDYRHFFDSNPPWVIESAVKPAVDIGKVLPWMIEPVFKKAADIGEEVPRGND